MGDEHGGVNLSYLDGAFEPAELDRLASKLSQVLIKTGLLPDGAAASTPSEATQGRSRDEADDACNVFLGPIGVELRELEPRRYGLFSTDVDLDAYDGLDGQVSRDTTAESALDAVLLASWLLRSGRVHSLDLQTLGKDSPFPTVLEGTLPHCAPTLKSMKLRLRHFSEADVEKVLSAATFLDSLESLDLQCTPLVPTALVTRILRASARTLRSIYLGFEDNIETADTVAALGQFSNLTALELSCFPFDDKGLEFLRSFLLKTETLQILSMTECADVELRVALQALCSSHTVKKAKFSLKSGESGRVGEHLTRVLADNVSLENLSLHSLFLDSPGCSAAVFGALKSNKTLKSFTLGLVDLPTSGVGRKRVMPHLTGVLTENRTLEILHLDGFNVSSMTLMTLAKALVMNTKLKLLRLDTDILADGDEDPGSFREAMRTVCDRMEAPWNRVGLEELSLALPQSSADTLYLQWDCEFEDPPLVDVLRGLCANRTITRLHLHKIELFFNAEMAALAEYLRNTTVLKSISMSYEIEYACYGIPLLDALADNTSVKRADLGTFDMDRTACEHFGAMLAKNSTLHWISLNECYAEPEELELVARGMEQNRTLLSLELGAKLRSPALSRIGRALAANGRRLNRAVDFVLDSTEEYEVARCEEAFRLLCHSDSLREQLANVTGASADRVEDLIHSAQKQLT